jgi:hypothetical protein
MNATTPSRFGLAGAALWNTSAEGVWVDAANGWFGADI